MVHEFDFHTMAVHVSTDRSVTFHVEPRLRTCKNAVESWPSDDRPVDVQSCRPMH
jgi:hypothetical protein